MFDVSRQHPLRRFLVALWACWFVVLITEPAMLHSCPMHDGAGASHAGAGEHGGHQMGHSASAGEMAGEMGPTTDAPPDNAAPHVCTCIGDCSASATVVPSYAIAMSWLAGIIELAPVLPMAHQAVPVESDFILPFANGPPPLSRSHNAYFLV